MKLRVYLRGLGIGMLVTALVLILSGNTEAKMSDAAVKRRAAELGMVEKDNTVLGDISGAGAEVAAAQQEQTEKEDDVSKPEETAKPEDSASKPEETAKPEDGASKPEETAKPEDGASKLTEGAESADNTAKPQAEKPEDVTSREETPAEEAEQKAEEAAKKAEEAAKKAQEAAENAPAGRIMTLEVHRGDTSDSVARRAAEAGLVQSAEDFDAFLCRNGYDKRISIGNYEIAEGSSEKDIADIITKSR